ncbi:MAG: hypothetical protein LUC30_10325 [Clostridiales bacterium]|nr:hypothetical protein [Clostridiales bacterium]
MEPLKLTIDTGAVTVDVYDADGSVIGQFRFNPADIDLATRYQRVMKELGQLEVPADAGSEEMLALTDKLKEQMNYLLNYSVSEGLFAKCNPLTLTGDGDFYVENVLDGIAGLINSQTSQRVERKRAKIRKATAKYHK